MIECQLFQVIPTPFICWNNTAPFLPFLYRSFICSAPHISTPNMNYYNASQLILKFSLLQKIPDHNCTQKNDALSSPTLCSPRKGPIFLSNLSL